MIKICRMCRKKFSTKFKRGEKKRQICYEKECYIAAQIERRKKSKDKKFIKYKTNKFAFDEVCVAL